MHIYSNIIEVFNSNVICWYFILILKLFLKVLQIYNCSINTKKEKEIVYQIKKISTHITNNIDEGTQINYKWNTHKYYSKRLKTFQYILLGPRYQILDNLIKNLKLNWFCLVIMVYSTSNRQQ